MTDADIAALTRRLAGTAVDYKELYEAAKRDAEEAEAYAAELEAKLAKADVIALLREACADLAADPLSDPRVKALIGAARAVAFDPAYMEMEDGNGEPCGLIATLTTALAALEGGKDE